MLTFATGYSSCIRNLQLTDTGFSFESCRENTAFNFLQQSAQNPDEHVSRSN